MLGERRAGVAACRATARRRRLLIAASACAAMLLGVPMPAGGSTRTASDRQLVGLPIAAEAALGDGGHGSPDQRSPSGGNRWTAYLAPEHLCPGAGRRDLDVVTQARSVECLINFARQRHGLRPLVSAALLNRASHAKALAIKRCGQFAHNPCGGDWTSSIRSVGYLGDIGENLFLGEGRFGTPRAAVQAWLESAPHRLNLFRPEWRVQGLALVTVARLGDFRDVSLWVSVLGAR